MILGESHYSRCLILIAAERVEVAEAIKALFCSREKEAGVLWSVRSVPLHQVHVKLT